MKRSVNRKKLLGLPEFPILAALLSIIAGIAGLYLGSVSRLANLTYPFLLAGQLPMALKRKRSLGKYGLFVPLVAFIAGFLAGRLLPVYPNLTNAEEWAQIKDYWRVVGSQVLS